MTKGTTQGAMASKKFKAFLLSVLGWNILIGVGIYMWMPLDQWGTITLLSMVVVQGVVEVGYIIGVAGLDALKALFDIITPSSIFGKKEGSPTDQPPEA